MPKLAITVLSVALLSLCHAGLSHADLFIFIDGIPGESHIVNRQNWIDIASNSWGVSEGPPGAPTKIQFRRLEITKSYDSTSPALALAVATGKQFREVRLEGTTVTGSAGPLVTTRIKLTGVRVTNLSTAGHETGTSYVLTDNVAFSFETITWVNFGFDQTGRLLPGVGTCFDLRSNTACPVDVR